MALFLRILLLRILSVFYQRKSVQLGAHNDKKGFL